MKKQIILLLLSLSQAVLFAQPRFDGSVFKPKQPKSGQTVVLEYDAKGKDLEFSDEVKATVFIFADFQWSREQISLTKNATGLWTASYPLKADVAFIGVKFFQGDADHPDAFDNNADKGYATVVYDAKGKVKPGTYIAEAGFQIPIIAGGGVFGYYSQETESYDATYLKSLAAKEQALSGKQLIRYFEPFMRLQQAALGEAFPAYAKVTIKKYLAENSFSDSDLNTIHIYVANRLKDVELQKLVENRVWKDYPKGATARFMTYSSTKGSSPDRLERIASYEDFLKKFPLADWQKAPNNQGFIYYAVFRGLGSAYFEERQLDKFIGLYDEIDFRTGNEVARWNIMRAYMFKLIGQDTLYQVSQAILPKLIARKGDNSYSSDFMDKVAADANMRQQMDDRLFTHISLLNDLGKYEEARQYFNELSDKGKYSNAELNEINLHVLEGLKDEKQILPLLEMSVRENAMTPKMFDKLKSMYLKQREGNLEGYDKYVTGLKSSEEMAELEAYVNEHLNFNRAMPDFEMEDADGKIVQLADWNDKIVVVDFWATWCRPCIMAFPGMQLLVDKYANDPTVGIYMVGTMQHGDYKSKSVNYVRGEGYRFNLLHDAVNPNTGEQDLVFKQLIPSVFSDSSIPRKIVIKNGVIRYSSSGYSGSPSKLMDELSLVIEKLKSE